MNQTAAEKSTYSGRGRDDHYQDLIDTDGPRNPFRAAKVGNVQTYYLVAEDRIRRVKEFDFYECEAALRVRGLQATVRRAIECRMRQLWQEMEK
jgi:hypothetical protein